MKLILIAALVMGAVVSNTEGAVISDVFKNFGESIKNSFTKLGSNLKEVGGAMVGLAKDKVKSLLGQSLQALFGAFASTIGKREIPEHNSFLHDLISRANELFEKTFSKSLKRIEEVIDDLVHNNSEEPEILERLNDMNAEHSLEVRSIIGDTLNKGINWAKTFWQKLTGVFKSTGTEDKVSDPVMVGKRELLSTLRETLQNIRDAIAPHVDNILQITKDIASTLGHHAGKLLEQHKNAAWENVKNTFSTMKDKLTEKLQEIVAGY